MSTALLVCRGPVRSQWQLGVLPPQQGTLILIGWGDASRAFDDGDGRDPRACAVIDGLTRVARLTFPCSELELAPREARWTTRGDDAAALVKKDGALATAVSMLAGRLTKFPLLSTTSPDVAFRLFDDAKFPWSLQGQFALLSPAQGAPPPVITDATLLLTLFEPGWSNALPRLIELGVDGVVRPGVDGDLLGILSRTPAFEDRIVASLADSAEAAGFGLEAVTEDELARRLGSIQ